MALYQQPNIRNLTAENLRLLIDMKQQQRLRIAREVQSARLVKLEKLSTKTNEAYVKLGDRAATMLAKVGEQFKELERILNKMQTLSNEQSLYETEMGKE